jgi:hypothetical protein
MWNLAMEVHETITWMCEQVDCMSYFIYSLCL